MQIYFGTVIRGAPVREGGHLHRLDWDRKQIVASQPIFPESPSLDHDPNPRGNTRGCRGVAVIGDKVLAAGYHTVGIFDLDLRALGSFSHGLMSGLHEVAVAGPGRLWVTSTTIDAALEFDWQKGRLLRQFWPREMPAFREQLGLTPLALDKQADQRAAFLGKVLFSDPSHLHLNAVAQWRDEVYALFHAHACIANLSAGTIVVEDPALRGAHNLVVQQEEGIAFVNDTDGGAVRMYDLRNAKLVRKFSLRRRAWVRDLARSGRASSPAPGVARPLFLRGLALSGPWLYVGLSPASILRFEWASGKHADRFQLTNNVHVAVHGIAVADS